MWDALRKSWVLSLMIVLAACGSESPISSEDRITALCDELYPMIVEYDDAMVDRFAELEEEARRLGIDAAIGPLDDAAQFMIEPEPGQDESFFYQALVGISGAFADAGYETCANLAASSELAPEGVDLEAVERNRQLWDEEGPTDYVLRLTSGGVDGPIRSYAIEVSDGEPTRAFQLGFGQQVPLESLADLPVTVEEAFDLIGREPGASVRIDHQVGNPTSYAGGQAWFNWDLADAGESGEFDSVLERVSQLQRDSYWLTYTVDCSCIEDEMSPISIRVEHGDVVSTELNSAYDGALPDHIPLTITDLVEVLQGNVFADDVSAEWENEASLHLTVDPIEGTGGEEIILGITVSDSPPDRGVGSVGEMQCGSITAPMSEDEPPLGDTDDPDLDLALEWFAGNEEGRFWVDTVEWSVWQKTDDQMILYGTTEDGYADASFVRENGSWRATGWGGCHWSVSVEGWGVAEWRVDGPVDADTTILTLAATERNCANGEAPEGRDIESVVWETDESVTIFIFVEPVSGFANCPGNPEFTWTIQLDSPVGERRLFDGSEVPPVDRSEG